MRSFRDRLSSAHLIAIAALFVALGGSAYAALEKNTVGTEQLKPRAVEHSDLAGDAVTGAKVENGTLKLWDFAENQLPTGGAGATGPAGPQGERGPQGPAGVNGADGQDGADGEDGADGDDGSPDTPQQVLDKLKQVDGSGSGIDADTLDGQSSAAFASAEDVFVLDAVQANASPGDTTITDLFTSDGVTVSGACIETNDGTRFGFFIVTDQSGQGAFAVSGEQPGGPSPGFVASTQNQAHADDFVAVSGSGKVLSGSVLVEVNDPTTGADCSFAGTFIG